MVKLAAIFLPSTNCGHALSSWQCLAAAVIRKPVCYKEEGASLSKKFY